MLRRAIPCWLGDADNGLTARFRRLLDGLWDDFRALDGRVCKLDGEITAIATNEPSAVRRPPFAFNSCAVSIQ